MTDLELGIDAAHSLISFAVKYGNSGGFTKPDGMKRSDASGVDSEKLKGTSFAREERLGMKRIIALNRNKRRGNAIDGPEIMQRHP